MNTIFEPLESQWQLALLVLCFVMGALLWRGHRQVTTMSRMAGEMRDQLAVLAKTVHSIEGQTTNTEHTLIANLAEYRMALGSTSAYRDYLQKLGVAPASDIEPILEAIPDGAMAIGKDGRILYVNRAYHDLTGLVAGMTIGEAIDRNDVRELHGRAITGEKAPETMVLQGEEVREVLLRMRPPGYQMDVILSVNGSPVRDVVSRVVAAVLVARPLSEEVALAVELRQRTEPITNPTS